MSAYGDPGHDAAEDAIAALSKRLHEEYAKAYEQMRKRAERLLKEQAEQDAEMVARVAAGEMSERQLKAWRKDQAADARWRAQMVDQLARDLASCDARAAAIINGATPAVFAENMDFGTFDVERAAEVDTSYVPADADTVAALVRDDPDLLPVAQVDEGKAATWARGKFASAVTQSILQGEGVDAAAERIRSVVDMGERASVRAARTAMTGAENAGRAASYERARGMGVDVRARWMATLDSRTRKSHRALDGEVIGDDGTFSNKCRFPGDPHGPAAEVWNCRCTLVASMPGTDALKDRNAKKLGTTYEEWKAGHDPKASGRSLKEFMETPAAERAAKRAGVGKDKLRERIMARLKAEGRTGRDFPSMTRAEQQEALRHAVELTRRQDKQRRDVKVVNDALYNSQKNYVERHGGVVKRDAEAAAYLDRKGAGASNYGDVLLLRPDASTSEVLEEVFHFKQHRRGDYSGMPTDEMIARREIDAQKFLLSVAERYNIPSSETELTKRNLAGYEDDLREILERRRGDHGGDRVNPA